MKVSMKGKEPDILLGNLGREDKLGEDENAPKASSLWRSTKESSLHRLCAGALFLSSSLLIITVETG